MNVLGEIEIHIEGKVGAQKLTPALVDIESVRCSAKRPTCSFPRRSAPSAP